jgi:hypothetical protein
LLLESCDDAGLSQSPRWHRWHLRMNAGLGWAEFSILGGLSYDDDDYMTMINCLVPFLHVL